VILNLLIGIAIAIGLFFHTLGVVGILRFPDVYTRLHADTKATTFGSIFTSLAVVLYALGRFFETTDGQYVSLILHTLIAVVVLAITNATGAHAIARAALRRGHQPVQAVVNKLETPAP
jgi:multicomponent Na+:H+ antiporter subunit G